MQIPSQERAFIFLFFLKCYCVLSVSRWICIYLVQFALYVDGSVF